MRNKLNIRLFGCFTTAENKTEVRKYQPFTRTENLHAVANESFARYFLTLIRNCGSADALSFPRLKSCALCVHTVVESGNT